MTIITLENLDTDALTAPCDMRVAMRDALAAGREAGVEYRRSGGYNEQAVHFVHFPNAGRGAVNGGGDSDWTDCYSLDDLEDRWENYDERWSN